MPDSHPSLADAARHLLRPGGRTAEHPAVSWALRRLDKDLQVFFCFILLVYSECRAGLSSGVQVLVVASARRDSASSLHVIPLRPSRLSSAAGPGCSIFRSSSHQDFRAGSAMGLESNFPTMAAASGIARQIRSAAAERRSPGGHTPAPGRSPSRSKVFTRLKVIRWASFITPFAP